MLRYFNSTQQNASVTQTYVYTLNNVEISRDYIPGIIGASLLFSNGNGFIQIMKRTIVDQDESSGARLTAKAYDFYLNLPYNIITKAIGKSVTHYSNLITLMLTMVDNGLAAVMNYNAHFRAYEESARSFFNSCMPLIIDAQSPLYSEILKFFTGIAVLTLTNTLYSATRIGLPESEFHYEKYHALSIPNIDFPELRYFKEIIDENEAKCTVDCILANIDAMSERVANSETYIPDAKKNALKTLDAIKDLSIEFDMVLRRAHEPAAHRRAYN